MHIDTHVHSAFGETQLRIVIILTNWETVLNWCLHIGNTVANYFFKLFNFQMKTNQQEIK